MRKDPLTYRSLLRRTVEIDFVHKHRHLGAGTLSALPIMAEVFEYMAPPDTFILSKGHACAALYAILESRGFHPNVANVHPERDPNNGITITSGSLGHGLPIGLGIAFARSLSGHPGKVHVLMGDGECLEGTTWEAINLARRLNLHSRLKVHVDANGFQGSDRTLDSCAHRLLEMYAGMTIYDYPPGYGVPLIEALGSGTHLVTLEEYREIMEGLK
jgi:transketolase N-terminal domain/subunit